MNKTLWRLQLMFWLARWSYVEWWQWRHAWRWSGEECWQMYYDGGYSPESSVLEDMSYG